MNDAIVLLSVSQIVCLGGLAYLYLQIQGLDRGKRRRPVSSMRAQPIEQPVQMPGRMREGGREPGIVTRTKAAPSPVAQQMAQQMAVPVATRMAELGVDVATMARRMNKSEEEVRLMLRRQAARS